MILFVCTGNTCRSPMAEALYKSITGKEAQSAGLCAASGALASDNAVSVMKDCGIDISGHKSRQIDKTMLEKADYVLTMTKGHKAMLLYSAPEYADKIYTVHEWAGKDGDVKDPFGGSKAVYEMCRKELEALIIEGEKIH